MRGSIKLGTIVCMMFIALGGGITKAQAQGLTPFSFEADENPQTLAKRYADVFASRTWYMKNGDVIHYADLLAADAAINFAHTTGDEALFADLMDKYEGLFDDDWDLLPGGTFVSSMPVLSFYNHSGDPDHLDRAYDLAGPARDYNPDPEDLATLAADGMFFIPTIDSRFYEIYGRSRRINRVTDLTATHLDYLLMNNGLIKHKEGSGIFFWGRGMGWASAGLANSLQSVPANDPDRAYMMESYLTMMAALKDLQTENGLWYQLINKPQFFWENGKRLENWEETSCTGMFAYAMLTGIRMGWLDQATYGPVVKDAWLGLVGKLNADGELTDTCKPTHHHDTAYDYLRTVRRGIGDYHAQAAFLWMAEALIIFNNEASDSNESLSVSITSPEETDPIASTEDIIVEFTATGSNLEAVRIFWAVLDSEDWIYEGKVTTEPYEFNIGSLPAGDYQIRAVAKDSQTAEKVMDTVIITTTDEVIDEPLSVMITSPSYTDPITPDQDIIIACDARGTDLGAVKVFVALAGTEDWSYKGKVDEEPFEEVNIGSLPAATYQIRAVASDTNTPTEKVMDTIVVSVGGGLYVIN